MAQLTPEQRQQYYAEEGLKASPISPLAWLAQQQPPATTSTIPQTGGIITPDVLDQYQVGLPTTPPDIKAFEPIGDTSTAFLKWWQEEQERIAKEKEVAETERKGWFEKAKETITSRPSYEEILEVGKEKYRIPEFYDKLLALTPEIDTLNQKLIGLNEAEQRGNIAIEQRLMGRPGEIIRGEQALYQRQMAIDKSAVAAQLGAKAALAQMYQGNISLANQLVSQTIEAQMYDINQKIEDYKFFFDYYDSYYQSLDKDIKDAITNQFNLILKQEEGEKNDLVMKYKLIQNAWSVGVDPGLTANEIKTKTYEEIASLVGPSIAAKAAETTTYAPTQYTKEWQEAGGFEGTGMTRGEYIMQRTGITKGMGKVYPKNEFLATIRTMVNDPELSEYGKSFQGVLDTITLSTEIANKEEARQWIAEYFGQSLPQEFQAPPELPGWMTGKTPEEIRKEMEKLTIQIPQFGTTLPESTLPYYY